MLYRVRQTLELLDGTPASNRIEVHVSVLEAPREYSEISEFEVGFLGRRENLAAMEHHQLLFNNMPERDRKEILNSLLNVVHIHHVIERSIGRPFREHSFVGVAVPRVLRS